MIKLIAAIDPGRNGGICVIDKKNTIRYLNVFSSKKEDIDKSLKEVSYLTNVLFLESAISMPTNRTTCNNLFFLNGYITGYAEGLGVQVISCSPRHWKNCMRLSRYKDESIIKAMELFNIEKELLSYPKYSRDGLAEALLLGYYAFHYFPFYPEKDQIDLWKEIVSQYE